MNNERFLFFYKQGFAKNGLVLEERLLLEEGKKPFLDGLLKVKPILKYFGNFYLAFYTFLLYIGCVPHWSSLLLYELYVQDGIYDLCEEHGNGRYA